MKRLLLCSVFGFCAGLGSARAEEKNGLMVTVTKKTLDRADSRAGYYTSQRIDRTQGLKVTIKNASFKEMPAGEVEWTLLVRRHDYSGPPTRSTGKEPLKALKVGETVEMVIGGAQITGWRDWFDQAKDKLEHQVIVRHGGAELLRISSTPAFDVLNKQGAARAGATN